MVTNLTVQSILVITDISIEESFFYKRHQFEIDHIHQLSTFTEFFPEPAPYLNKSLKPEFSKTTRQKLKIKLFSNRARVTLSEYIFNWNFRRRTFEKFELEVRLRYSTEWIREKSRWKCCMWSISNWFLLKKIILLYRCPL